MFARRRYARRLDAQFDERATAHRAAHQARRAMASAAAAPRLTNGASRVQHRREQAQKQRANAARQDAALERRAHERRRQANEQRGKREAQYVAATQTRASANAALREARDVRAAKQQARYAAHDFLLNERAGNLRAIRNEKQAKYEMRKARADAMVQNRSDVLRGQRNDADLREATRIGRLAKEQRTREANLRQQREAEKEEKERNFRDNVEERMKRADATVAAAAAAVSKVSLGHASAGGVTWGPGYHTRRERLEEERAVREERLHKNIEVREKGRMKGLKKLRRRKEKRAMMESARAAAKQRTRAHALKEKRLKRVARERALVERDVSKAKAKCDVIATLVGPTKKVDSRVATQAAIVEAEAAERELGMKERRAKAAAVVAKFEATKEKEERVRHENLLQSKGRRVKGTYWHPLDGRVVETYRDRATHQQWNENAEKEAVKTIGLNEVWDRKEYLVKKDIDRKDAAIRIKEEGIRHAIDVRRARRRQRLARAALARLVIALPRALRAAFVRSLTLCSSPPLEIEIMRSMPQAKRAKAERRADAEERNRQLAEEQRRIHRTAHELRAEERRAWGKAADIEREAAVRRLVERRQARLGKLEQGDAPAAPNGPTAAGRRRLKARMTVMQLKRARTAAQEQAKFNKWGDEAFPSSNRR
jgi:hypothetical protein